MVENNLTNLSSILEDMPFPIIVVTPKTYEFVWGNSCAEDWLGRSRNNLTGKTIEFLSADKEALYHPLARCEETGGAVSVHDMAMRKNHGPEVVCNLTAYPCAPGIAIQIRPVERPRASHTDTDNHAIEALGRMLAHELKNPLAGIKGAAQLLSLEAESDEANELLQLIATETDRIRRLADRMEAFGDIDELTARDVNIHSVLRQARLLAQNATESEIKFTEHYDPSLPTVYGDQDALMQVALNLLVNAAEAIALSGKGHEIRLETSYRAGIRSAKGVAAKPLSVEIRVIDNGPGISSAIKDQLFQPFVTDKPAGRGLGLTLVSKIVAAHDGMVNVQSRPGETIFSILLPASQAQT